MYGLRESQTSCTETLLVAPVLQTRAPIGKFCGPAAGLLLSRPTTFQVSGVTLSVACAASGASATTPSSHVPSAAHPLRARRRAQPLLPMPIPRARCERRPLVSKKRAATERREPRQVV